MASYGDWYSPIPDHLSWLPAKGYGQCTGWFWPHGYDVQALSEDGRGYPVYFLCRLCLAQNNDDPEAYDEDDTELIERHLSKAHNVHQPDPSSKTRRSLPKRDLHQPDLRSFPVKKQKTDGAQKESVARIESIDRPTFQRRLVQWATNANPAVDILEHSELRDVFDFLDPSFKGSSLTLDTLRNIILAEVNLLKARVIKAFKQSPSRVHISFESSTSEDRRSCFTINASFLSPAFKPQKIILGIPDLTTFDTGQNFSGAVVEVLKEYKLLSQDNNEVGCFVLNDAPDSDRAIEELGRMLQWQNPSQRRVRCFGQVLRHVAQTMLFADKSEGVDGLDPYDLHEWAKRGPVGRLHIFLAWIKQSDEAASIIETLQVEDPQKKYTGTLDVLLNDNTVWLPQYAMIDRAIKLQPYLKELSGAAIEWSTLYRSAHTQQQIQDSVPLCLSDENLLTAADWKALGWFNVILHRFESCFLKEDRQVFPSQWPKGHPRHQCLKIWEVLPSYHCLRLELRKARAEAVDRPEPSYYSLHINAAWTEMEKHYAKLDETPIYYAATVLHPGTLWSLLTKLNVETEEWLGRARQLIQTLWEEEYRDLAVPWEMTRRPGTPEEDEEDEDDEENELNKWNCNKWVEPLKGVLSDELERWFCDIESTSWSRDADPLEYWSWRQFDYHCPRVAKMAVDIYSVPAIAAECERSFPAAGGLASLNQAQLDTSTTAISQAVKSWVKAGLLGGYDGLLKEL
ncbi:uncharacterized protein CPUR_03261 [Claviceps purpurea 20.1]|uniref:HAT C-terminal dimerisation domain-containing protein n=1 Tax=Claviceps purpurea (strain 20.1) TaxID=1111077 RepID=M1VZT9_CLAP2|nr:uncharacterized protein CPUR_03261 [Claviceps purpurea 20.1]